MRTLKTAYLAINAVALMAITSSAKADGEAASPLPVTPITQTWAIRLPAAEIVTYKGLANFDQAGLGTGSMMYPAPNAIGLLAAVLTHEAINESSKNSQRTKIQEEADKVLAPYRVVLDSYTYKDLMQSGAEKISSAGDKKVIAPLQTSDSDWLIESTPLFFITQDQSAIIVDTAVSIYSSKNLKSAARQYNIKVISRPRDEKDLTNFWITNQGENLKQESARLFARSLDIAISDITKSAAVSSGIYKTIRYDEGKTEKIERAQIVGEDCDQLLVKTLRGGFLSVPKRKSAADTQCEAGTTNTIKPLAQGPSLN